MRGPLPRTWIGSAHRYHEVVRAGLFTLVGEQPRLAQQGTA